MSNKILEATAKALRVWQANTDMKLKDLALKEYEAQHERLGEVLPEITAYEEKLTPLRNERDALVKTLRQNTTRVRGNIRTYFGANSNEYELAGGKRVSERKPRPSAKAKAAKTDSATSK